MKKFVFSLLLLCCLFFNSGLQAVTINTNAGHQLIQNLDDSVVRLWEGLARDVAFPAAPNLVPAIINLPAAAPYALINNQNHHCIKLLNHLQAMYVSDPTIFNMPLSFEKIVDKVSDLRFDHAQGLFDSRNIALNPKKRDCLLERVQLNINPTVLFPFLRAAYEYEFSDPVKKGLARQYAVALCSTMRNPEANESEAHFMGNFDIDLMDVRADDFRNLNEAIALDLAIKNDVRRQYNIMYRRWIDGSSMNFGAALDHGVLQDLRYLMNPDIPGFSFIPQLTMPMGAAPTLDAMAEACYSYLTSWTVFGMRWFGPLGFTEINWDANTWTKYLPQELLKEVEMKMLLRHAQRVSSGSLEKLTPGDLVQLGQHRIVAPCDGFATLREIARHWSSIWRNGSISTFFKEDEDRWFLFDSSGNVAQWLDILPTECRNDLCRYHRSALIKELGMWVDGFHICSSGNCRMNIHYMTELAVIPLPRTVHQGAFDGMNERQQAEAFAQDFVHRINIVGKNPQNIQRAIDEIQALVQCLPSAFIQKVCWQYGLQTAFRGQLLKDLAVFKELVDGGWDDALTIPLADLLELQVVRERIQHDFTQKNILNLSGLHLSRLTAQDFHGGANPISGIAGIDFNQVTELDLSNNKLQEFPLAILNHFPHLTTLRLSHNRIKTLHEDLFGLLNNGLLPELKTLCLDHNEFAQLPQSFFKGLVDNQQPLDLVDLSYNKFKDGNLLPNFGSLKVVRLNLGHNQLENLPENIFSHMVGVNGVLPIAQPDPVFNRNIKELDLSHNALKIVSNDSSKRAFNSLANGTLEFLDLSYNDITSIYPIISCEITSLKHLLLDNNKIDQSLHGRSQALADMNALETLSLARNELRVINDDDFTRFPHLKRLILSQNKIETVIDLGGLAAGSGLSRLGDLEFLALDRNLLERISINTFKDLRNLKALHLEGNKITQFKDDVFRDLDNLEALYLCGNARTFSYDDQSSIRDTVLEPNAFRNLGHLRFLDLSYNRIKELPGTLFSGLTNLTHLNLAHNRIKYLADQLAPLINLEMLDLSENKMESVLGSLSGFLSGSLSGSSFFHQDKLKKIHFKGNNAGGILKPLSSLVLWKQGRTLDMEGCKKISHDAVRFLRFLYENRAMKVPGLYCVPRFICWVLGNPIRMEQTFGREFTSLEHFNRALNFPKCSLVTIDNYYQELEKFHRDLAFGDHRNARIVQKPLS